MKVLISTIDTKTHEIDLVIINVNKIQDVEIRFINWSCIAYKVTDSTDPERNSIEAVYKNEFKYSTVIGKAKQI